jgi:hypothetical protein
VAKVAKVEEEEEEVVEEEEEEVVEEEVGWRRASPRWHPRSDRIGRRARAASPRHRFLTTL